MKKLRITVDGKVFDVSVELLDQVSSTTSAPAPAPVAAPAPAPAASAPVFWEQAYSQKDWKYRWK